MRGTTSDGTSWWNGEQVQPEDIPPAPISSDRAAYVDWIVSQAPPLSAEQRHRLGSLLMQRDHAEARKRHEREAREKRREKSRARREQELAELKANQELEQARRRCALYRHWDADGVLLYVGISNDSHRRRTTHINKARWARFHAAETVEWLLPDRQAAEAAESSAIHNEQPIFNKRGAAPGAPERLVQYLAQREAWDMLKGDG